MEIQRNTITRDEIRKALREKNLINNRSKYVAISINGEAIWISKNVAIHVLSDPYSMVDIQDQNWKGLGKVKVVVAKVYITF